MKALASVLWVLCLGTVLALLFMISNDRTQLTSLAHDQADVSHLREKLVEDIKLMPEMNKALHQLRPGPLQIPRDRDGRIVRTGSQKTLLKWVCDVLAQGYPAGDLVLEPGKRKGQWRASLMVADQIEP